MITKGNISTIITLILIVVNLGFVIDYNYKPLLAILALLGCGITSILYYKEYNKTNSTLWLFTTILGLIILLI